MNPQSDLVLQVSDAIALINQTLDYAYPAIIIEGEVASFKVNQNKFVFFDIKDESGTLGCFMMVYQLRIPLEDGMRVRIVAQPKITQWGKFSLTVRDVQPSGEGSLKRAFQLLHAKLEKEGLFAAERKRPLPDSPARIGVISSTAAAGYADFIKILGERWGGMEVIVAHTQVQGLGAPQQIVNALEYFNEMGEPPELIAIIRGGGSADDLSAFNDEPLVRAIASSRVPVVTGIGHEIDTSLSDLAADVQASTPSNVAQLIVPDKREIARRLERETDLILDTLKRTVEDKKTIASEYIFEIKERIEERLTRLRSQQRDREILLKQLDPKQALKRGYSLLRDEEGRIVHVPKVGDRVMIETKQAIIRAGVEDVQAR